MIGRVSSVPEAIVALQVRGPEDHEVEVEAVLDTGFTDYLTLPPEMIGSLRLVLMTPLNANLRMDAS